MERRHDSDNRSFSKDEVLELQNDCRRDIDRRLFDISAEVHKVNIQLALTNQNVTQMLTRLEAMDRLLRGGESSSGLVAEVGEMAKVIDEVAKDMWNTETGIGIRVKQLWEKKAAYDDAVKKMEKAQQTIVTVGVTCGVVGSIVTFLFEKVDKLRGILGVLK